MLEIVLFLVAMARIVGFLAAGVIAAVVTRNWICLGLSVLIALVFASGFVLGTQASP